MSNPFVTNLKLEAEKAPFTAVAIAALALTAASKLMDANTARISARTHAKEVERRINKSK